MRLSPARLLKERPGALLAALTLLALALRLAWGLGALASDVALVDQGDYASYKLAAQHFLEHGDFSNRLFLVRPPAFPLLIALAGLNDTVVIALNALAGALLAPLTWLLARRLGLRAGSALLAALLVAIDPLSVRFTAFLGPEALAFVGALALMLCLLALLQARTQRRAILWGIAAALMLLLSVYARPASYLIWSGLALWLLALNRRRWPALLAFVLISLAGMQLWVNHNAAAFGNPSLSTIGTWTMTYYRAMPVLRLATGMSVAQSEAQITAAVATRLGEDPETGGPTHAGLLPAPRRKRR